ncbi:hypothetical protein TRFO_34191 [Tritrichomonas foetus]|uniref:Uncharacterized protein n=1 Tax=Tritrichomonas foetus TaxID=1144522 RepID=A0A1J4JL32_9EUKA|nr:hypothetical protein TRFO_34191 [Tritrichomonas foetus]|eukprot:OHS99377.1 hypothetical protein TRFO_34191 [Tritrichomonas foetus]
MIFYEVFNSKHLMEDPLKQAIHRCEEMGTSVLYSGFVMKQHDNRKGQAKRILIITDQFITYFKEGDTLEVVRTNYWCDVTSFKFNTARINLTFRESIFRFVSDETPSIANIINEIILRTLTVDEVDKLNLENYHCISINPKGALSRCGTIIGKQGKSTKEFGSYDKLRIALTTQQNWYKLSKDDVKNYLDSILETIRVVPNIKTYIFPKLIDGSKIFKALSEIYDDKTTNVSFLVFKCGISQNSKDFHSFIDSLKKSSNIHLKGLSFMNAVDFSNKNLEQIQKLFSNSQNEQLNSLVLSGISPTKRITNLFNKGALNSVRYLALDKTIDLDFPILIPALNNIQVLSLKYCNLEITSVIKVLYESNLHLKYLDLSSNICTEKFPHNISLPSDLDCLYINDMKWEETTFPDFFEAILRSDSDNGLKLHCDSLKISDNDYSLTFEMVKSIPAGFLTEFSWNNNQIHENLMEFLVKNVDLHVLFLKGVFSVYVKQPIIKFCKILPRFVGLTHLVLSGTRGNEIGDEIISICESLKKLNRLHYLDVSNNMILDEGIHSLLDLLLNNKSIKTICFDNSEISSTGVLDEFISELIKARRRIKISYPREDIEKLLSFFDISPEYVENLKIKIKCVAEGEHSILPPKPIRVAHDDAELPVSQKVQANKRSSFRNLASVFKNRGGSMRISRPPTIENDPNSFFNRPFEVFYSHFDGSFPQYLDEKLEEKLSGNYTSINENSILIDANIIVNDQPKNNDKSNNSSKNSDSKSSNNTSSSKEDLRDRKGSDHEDFQMEIIQKGVQFNDNLDSGEGDKDLDDHGKSPLPLIKEENHTLSSSASGKKNAEKKNFIFEKEEKTKSKPSKYNNSQIQKALKKMKEIKLHELNFLSSSDELIMDPNEDSTTTTVTTTASSESESQPSRRSTNRKRNQIIERNVKLDFKEDFETENKPSLFGNMPKLEKITKNHQVDSEKVNKSRKNGKQMPNSYNKPENKLNDKHKVSNDNIIDTKKIAKISPNKNTHNDYENVKDEDEVKVENVNVLIKDESDEDSSKIFTTPKSNSKIKAQQKALIPQHSNKTSKSEKRNKISKNAKADKNETPTKRNPKILKPSPPKSPIRYETIILDQNSEVVISSLSEGSSYSESEPEEFNDISAFLNGSMSPGKKPGAIHTEAPDLKVGKLSPTIKGPIENTDASWEFPVPRQTRVSNKHITGQYEDQYSPKNVVKSVKARK